jgi:hypothetical protein
MKAAYRRVLFDIPDLDRQLADNLIVPARSYFGRWPDGEDHQGCARSVV